MNDNQYQNTLQEDTILKRNFTIIFFVVLFGMLSIAAFNPILGPLARNLGLTEVQSGSLITVMGICWIIGSYLWGKWGLKQRKTILTAALILYSITLLAFGYIADQAAVKAENPAILYWTFFALRAVAGFAYGAIPALTQAYIMDWTTVENRTSGMTLFGSATGLGFVLGPALGGVLAPFSLTASMYLAAALLLIIAIVAGMNIPVAKINQEKKKSSWLSPLDRRIRMYITIGFVLSTVNIILQVTIGFYLQDQLSLTTQRAAQIIGLGISLAGAVMIFMQILISKVLKWSPTILLRVGLPAMCLAFLSFWIFVEYYLVAFILIGIGIGFTMPGFSAAASLAVDEGDQSSVASFIAAVQGVGAFVGPIVGTVLYSVGPYIPYLLCVVILGFFCPLVFLGRKKENLQSTN